jgi:hypothetical protein
MEKKTIKKTIPLIVISVIVFSAVASSVFWTVKNNDKVITKLTSNIALAFDYDLSPYFSRFLPRYPQRLKYLSAEITEASQQLTNLNKELADSLEECNCEYAQSSCRRIGNSCRSTSLGAYGDPCLNRKEIEKKQSEIEEKTRHISFLRDLLIEEMGAGLEKELGTVDSERAEELLGHLNNLLTKSENIVSTREKSLSLPNQCSADKCQASCQSGRIFSFQACVLPGEHEPIVIKLKAKVEIEDLELGEVSINKVDLGLPEKIEIPNLGKLSGFSISPKETTFNIADMEGRTVYLQTPKMPSLPELPSLDLGYSDLTGSSTYTCNPSQEQEDIEFIEHEWFYQKYSYLSTKCQELPGYRDQLGLAGGTGLYQAYGYRSDKYNEDEFGDILGISPGFTLSAEGCFHQDNLPQAIKQRCWQLWEEYCECDPDHPEIMNPKPPEFCRKIYKSCLNNGDIDIAAADRCKELYQSEGLATPSSCYYTVREIGTSTPAYLDEDDNLIRGCCLNELDYYRTSRSNCIGYIYSRGANFDPIGAIDSLCEEIKEEERKDQPEVCKMLPIFTNKIKTPPEEIILTEGTSCSEQTIKDFPPSQLGKSASLPTIPKIKLPEIRIPDIVFPSFNLSPFLSIELPSFVFEDLVFDEIELCNLDACRGSFPELDFQFPILSLPEINLDPIELGESSGIKLPSLDPIELGESSGIKLPSIELSPIKLPNIPLPFLQKPSLGDVLTPELDLPKIEMPDPKVSLSFSGLELKGIFGYIATFITNALGWPAPGYCVSYSLKYAPLSITFPDYYFYWPAFLRIPEIDFCKDINNFCKETTDSFSQITEQVNRIETIFNNLVQAEIQARLNEGVPEIKRMIEEHIRLDLGKQRERILSEIQEQIDSGKDKITISTWKIDIPEIPLDGLLDLPGEIAIPWPEDLKNFPLTAPLTYDLPTIPLNELSYEKLIELNGPGFQSMKFTSSLDNLGTCLAREPKGGNPCPQTDFQKNLGQVESLYKDIDEIYQNIKSIL